MKSTAKSLYPFVPSGPYFKDAIDFFGYLGFKKLWENLENGLVALKFGDAQFLLQNIDIKAWQENQIIIYEVDDLDRYYAEVMASGLSARFPNQTMGQPQDYPWGQEIHFIDLGGVCWHVRQQLT